MLQAIKKITDVDFFKEGQDENLFVGRPFYIDYNKANVLISDIWKYRVKGVPQGSFLLAFYDNPNDEEILEAILLRVIRPASLPTDSNVVSSMVEYYKDNLNTSGKKSDLDDFTKYEFSFSGLECSILGTFYKHNDHFEFGADVENFYSAHNYKVYKATSKVLELIVNQRDKDLIAGGESEFSIGRVRYSSSRRFNSLDTSVNSVQVFINPTDLLGKRTALFGMTRTGKSNSVKKIIEATVEISSKAEYQDILSITKPTESILEPFKKENGAPKFKVGQIIFDINGEYANANLQDKGTAIFDLYSNQTVRYSILDKQDSGFNIMKVNFYNDIITGFEYIVTSLLEDNSDYVTGFTVVNLEEPEKTDISAYTRYLRKVSVYHCCLKRAGFEPPTNFKVKFEGSKELNAIVENAYGKIVPDSSLGITLDEAINWWKTVWDNKDNQYFLDYKRKKGKDWIDEELESLLTFLTQKKPTGSRVSGYTKLKRVLDLHTHATESSFQKDILKFLRQGKIVVIDLSQGDPKIQGILSERICKEVFGDSMKRFTQALPNNFIQFYFEEAHNLFPKKDDKDLSQLYNRIAKEGAKLNLGMIYATQEVSSISGNILKNTQN